LKELIADGYEFHLLFLWLPSADVAVARVVEWVRAGGHNVPEETVRRWYVRGVLNFFELYQPLATRWRVYSSAASRPRLIARGQGSKINRVLDRESWRDMMGKYGRDA
jgi:predicted ABC-type ATPase